MVVAGVGAAGAEPDDDMGLFVDVADPAAGPSDQLANRELSGRLTAAIGALPMNQRTAFLLHHVHGLSLEDAAAVMGCRVGTVKSHIFRATAALRQRISPWLTEERA
jgi:RNA polymerase sigma-70 factor (ECF subfamily)